MPIKNRVFTIDEVAKYLRVHPSTIRRQIEAGGIPAYRVGGTWRLDKDAIDKWKKEQEKSNCRSKKQR